MNILDSIYSWVKNLSFFAVLSTTVLQMVPDHGFQKYVRFFHGLLMVSMLILPILKITGKEEVFSEIYKSREYREQIEENNQKRQNLIEQIKILEKNSEETQNKEEGLTNERIEVEQIEIGKDGHTLLGE